ncbi:DUF3797 domain-containing protein [Virgibacillus sp. FSP13]
MIISDSLALIKKYGKCPKCGNDKIGNGEGTMVIEDNVFERTCKCGWSVIEDKRIKCVAYMTTKNKGKTTGIYEVKINGRHKYLPLNELKEKSGATRVNQTKKIEGWLNTLEGREWALTVREPSAF